ncbi:Aste57867_25323 [Aphanomyces stellatus]|uniref:Aste57867_25323 protein n=1 Tax=Aphanomyces stellatus TaxID=120398 RepID=A0A485LTI2_9STRA|nr:hypothetical protein As57867_025245 [Aphanomyces stellatus]VFU01948.1 Aste57867_25323 [Aphanomyces stellatus]
MPSATPTTVAAIAATPAETRILATTVSTMPITSSATTGGPAVAASTLATTTPMSSSIYTEQDAIDATPTATTSSTMPSLMEHCWASGAGSLSTLRIDIPGRVVVSFDANQSDAATFVATSDSQAVLDAIQGDCDIMGSEPNTHEAKHHELHLRLVDRDMNAEGSLLVHVTVNHPISTFSTSTETIVQNGVLAFQSDDDKVKISTMGKKTLWIESMATIKASNISIEAMGSGEIFLTAPTAQLTNTLKLSSLGTGSIGFHATSGTISATTIHSSSLGTGSIVLHGNVVATTLKSELLGQGSISYYPTGKVDDSKVSILGSGNAYLGSIQTQTTFVETMGLGTAHVQAVDTLNCSGFGSGSIKYFNVTPTHLPKEKRQDGWFPSFPAPKVEHTVVNTFDTLTVPPVPDLHEGSHVLIVVHSIGKSFWSDQNAKKVRRMVD